jgi:DNA-binding NarL/FixJ family response regulator
MTVRLLILVAESTFADVLGARLEAEQDLDVVAALYARAPSPQLFTAGGADVVLLDGDFDHDAAFGLCAELSQRGHAMSVILLSRSSEPRRIVRGIEAGALGWVRKDESLDRLIDVIHGVARGETWLPARDTGTVLQLLLRRPDPEARDGSHLLAVLTPREREVLACLAEGTGRREMAEQLHMSPNTLRTHLQNLMAKLGVHSALEAVALTRSHLGGSADSPKPPGHRRTRTSEVRSAFPS